MKTRLGRWAMVIVIALGALGAIGLALGGLPSVRAAGVTYIYPGPSCTGTLQDCVDKAGPGDVIQIRAGVYITTVNLRQSVSLIGEGVSNTELQAPPRFRVLTIDDTNMNNPITATTLISGFTVSQGDLVPQFCPEGCGGGILITGTARPTLQNLMLTGNTAWQGGGLWVNTGDPVLLRNVAFVSNTAVQSGGGLYAAADVLLNAGYFQWNQTIDPIGGGGGLWAERTAVLTTTTFVSNSTAGASGGGAYVFGDAQLWGGRFQGNHADNGGAADGGGLYASTISANGTQFVDNYTAPGCSVCRGGGAYASFYPSVFANVWFTRNLSSMGGGLYASGDVTFTNVVMKNNTADFQGGGALVNGLATLIGGRFDSNHALSYSGGGLFASNLALAGTQFVNNESLNGGGGGASIMLMAQMQNGRFENNRSYSSGGGLAAGGLDDHGSSFVDNRTTGPFSAGGGAFIQYAAAKAQRPAAGLDSAELQGTVFLNNAGTDSGGGLFVGGMAVLTDVTAIGNVAAAHGGGVYGGAVTIEGGAYHGNVGGGGGGAYAAFGPLSIARASFTGNEASGGGGGAYANSTALVTNANFQNNTAGFAPGGGLYAVAGADASNTVFISNSAGDGGGIYSTGILNLTNIIMRGNQVTNDGVSTGGAVASTADVFVSGGVYDGNQAQRSGGAFFVSGVLNMSGAQVTNNYVTNYGGQGGGVYSVFQTTIDHSRLANNLASNGYGGGLYSTGPLVVAQSLFISNNASDGGALYQAASGDARVVNSLFASNQVSSTLQGAALSFNMLGSAEVAHDTIVDRGPLTTTGAAINANAGSTVYVTDTIIGQHQIGINGNGGSVDEDYNLYFATPLTQTGTVTPGLHSVTNLIPAFSNPLQDDYHLQMGSPGTNLGVLLPDVLDDYDGQIRPLPSGSKPDIGYDEVGTTIQQMIDSAPPGATVYVPSGDYAESLTLNRPVNLVGAGSNVGIPTTVLHAVANNRVLTVTGSINRSTLIANLKLMGGDLTVGCADVCVGGGVLVTGTASPTFDNVDIEQNQANLGGGIYFAGGGALLKNTQIKNNKAFQSGGGIYVAPGGILGRSNSPLILFGAVVQQTGGLIANNQAVDGAGVFVQEGLYQLYNGDIVKNTAERWGGGLLAANSTARAELVNSNLISNNTLTTTSKGGGIFVHQGQVQLAGTLVMSNTSVQGGGIFITGTASSGRLDVDGGKFIGNGAEFGGAVYALGSYGITNTRFFQNYATSEAAVLNQGGSEGRIVNAFMADNVPGSISSAILNFDGGAQAQVFHDTFANNGTAKGYAVTVNGGAQVTVANTIFATYTTGISNTGGAAFADYNLFFGNTHDYSGTVSIGTHSLYGANPLFQNTLAYDLHLKGLSLAVNRGKEVGVRFDIDLDARPLAGAPDIGADEVSVTGTNASPVNGGMFTYTTTQNSTINMVLPPGAVTQTTPLYCTLLNNTLVQPPSRAFQFAGIAFELDALADLNGTPGSISFNVPVTLSVSYTDQQLATAGITDELQLKLYRFETSVNQWMPIGFRPGESQILDTDNNLITATILSFSRFGTMAPSSTQYVFLPLAMR